MTALTETPAPATLTPLALPTAAIASLQTLESDLCNSLLERSEQIRAALVAVLARQHIVLIGPPGTAKSLLVTALAERIGTGLQVFVRLMTRYSKPEELFGPISVAGLEHDRFEHVITHMLPEADLVFLDEVFKANSAILNALLTVMNERRFDNGPTRLHLPLISLFGASNELPQGEDLNALWDRFALRCMTEYVSDAGFPQLLKLARGRRSRHGSVARVATLAHSELLQLQDAAASLPIPDGVLAALEQARKDLQAKGIIASDRRWGQMLDLVAAHALCEGRGVAEEDDLIVLKDALWQAPEQRQEIGRIVARLSNPLNAKAVELGDQAASVHAQAMEAQKNSGLDDEAKMKAAIEAATKFKTIVKQVNRLYEQAETQGRATARIAKVQAQLREMHQQVASLVL
jgi:MoxR-like ATPase